MWYAIIIIWLLTLGFAFGTGFFIYRKYKTKIQTLEERYKNLPQVLKDQLKNFGIEF